ncbi:MAG: hypothetical protein JXQ73_28040 [Phycisphaerae bacterium]|nr:hypothetical protein [Phycisphaerae bacterium]
MLAWFRQLDDLLRGRKTAPDLLAEGEIELPLRAFVPLAVVLGATYGFFMGWYAVLCRDTESYWQVIASMVKLPALFLLTLVVTFPSLYVFNALVGCRLSFGATLRLLVGAVVINVAVGASFGPILGFFTLSTTSYPFMTLLNVVLLGISGIVALTFLLHTLRRLSAAPKTVPPRVIPAEDAQGDSPLGEEGPFDIGPIERPPDGLPEQALGKAWGIFQIWVIIYGLVGAQMGWLLRPFIGAPTMEFTWFRSREGNFFQAVHWQIHALFAGS